MESRMPWTIAISVIVIGSLLSVVSCEDENRAKLLAAQKCLDEIQTDPNVTTESNDEYKRVKAEAEVCLEKIGSQTGQQASIIRCSAQSLRGGITAKRFIDAYTKLAVKGTPNTAAYMIGLAVNTGSTTADNNLIAGEIFSECTETGIDSLVQMSGFIKIGTLMAGTTGCANADTTNYQSCIDGQGTSNIVQKCKDDPTNCDPSDVGNTAITIKETYCTGANKDTEVCKKIGEAVGGSTNPDPSTVGAALLELIKANNN